MSAIWVEPRISEKSYFLATKNNTYIFDVAPSSNKQQISAAIEDQFDVSVIAIRTSIAKGKVKKTPVKGGYPITGRRKNVKRAYVTLAAGDSISVFEDLE